MSLAIQQMDARIRAARQLREEHAARHGGHPIDVWLSEDEWAQLDRIAPLPHRREMRTLDAGPSPEPRPKPPPLVRMHGLPETLSGRIREACRLLADRDGNVSRAALFAALDVETIEERCIVARRIANMRGRGVLPYAIDDSGKLRSGPKTTGLEEIRAWCAEHQRDGSVSRAELYAAFGATTPRLRQRLSALVGTMVLRGQFPWALRRLAPHERVRRGRM